MRTPTIASLLTSVCCLGAIQASAQTTPLGVEFLGRVTGTVSAPGLLQADVAGVVPQLSWNTIDDGFTFAPSFSGESALLIDTNLNTTAVTLSFVASDSWYNDTDPAAISTPNAKLLNGINKANGADGKTSTYQFNHVPEGTYDLYVYTTMNGDGVSADVSDGDNITTYYIKEWHQFYDTNTFVRATNTTFATGADPGKVRDTGNYVKFSGLGTFGRGTIGASIVRRGTAADGTGVPALQLVPAGAAQVNSTPLSLLAQPISRRGADGASNVTFSVRLRGPAFFKQWYQNGNPIPGETGASYTPSPISVATMQNAQISFKATNNLNSVTTSNAILTVGQLITVNGAQVLNGGTVNITAQPQPATKIAVRSGPATFRVAATSGFIGDASGASPPINYQWQSAPKTSSTFTDIAGATNVTYRTSVLQLADDGTKFRAAVTASDATVNSDVALLTVLPNTNPPVATAGAIIDNSGVVQVGVSFDEQVDPATVIAANFSLGAGTVSSFKLATNTYKTYAAAILNTTGLTPGSTYTLTAHGVTDLSGNVLPSTNLSFTVPAAIKWAESGSPVEPGQVVPVGKDGFDILNSGRQEWANYDEVDMAYVKKTNDFDVKVQVIFVEPASQWTRCGLQARNALDVGEPFTDYTNTTTSTASAYAQTHVNSTLDLKDTGLWPAGDPNQIVAGASNNGHEQNTRPGKGAATKGWDNNSAGGVPNFPDVWLRLARQGAVLHGYRSEDGVTWIDQGTTTLTDQQPDMYVGMSLSAETGNIWNGTAAGATGPNPFNVWTSPFDPNYDRLFVGQFRNFGDFVASQPGPTATISQSGSVITITFSGSALQQSPTLGATATWTAVPNATSPYTVPKSSSAMFFRAKQ